MKNTAATTLRRKNQEIIDTDQKRIEEIEN
jgi:hypothetical protein